MNRLVVFDLDDTLYLERDYVLSGFRAVDNFVRRELGVRGFLKDAWSRFDAGQREFIFDRALEARGLAPRLVRKLLGVYRRHAPHIRLCPDARRFLGRPPGGVAVGIITDGRLPAQRAKIRALGIGRLVGDIVITGRWGARYAKPHPRAFLWMERRFGVSGSACAYVGDNPSKDFEAPRALGWSVFRLRRPGGLYAGAASRGVPEIRSCDELRERLSLKTRRSATTSKPSSPHEELSLPEGAGGGGGASKGRAARTASTQS